MKLNGRLTVKELWLSLDPKVSKILIAIVVIETLISQPSCAVVLKICFPEPN